MHHHGHDHGHCHHDITREGNKKGLTIALLITTGIMFLEFFGGLMTNSLALLSDSGHMLSDASSLALSLIAMWFATKSATANKTYGFYRFEILAALFNGITLFLIAGFITFEAFQRFLKPENVSSGSMILIASIGLFANLLSAFVLLRQGDVKHNINLRSAYLHVLGDALGSIGAITAGLLMYYFGWFIADPIISVIVSLLILKSSWGVLKRSVHVLMEGTPVGIDQANVLKLLEDIDGVRSIHDLHIWTLTSGLDFLTCHLVIDDDKNEQEVLQKAIDIINDMHHITHTTIQVEKSYLHHAKTSI